MTFWANRAEFTGPPQGSRAPEFWSLPAQGQPGSQLHPPSATPSCPACAPSVGGGSRRPSSPTFACDYHHIDLRPRRGRNGQVTFCIWDLINSSCRLLTYIHHTAPPWSRRRSSLASFNKRCTAQPSSNWPASLTSGIATPSRYLQQGQPWEAKLPPLRARSLHRLDGCSCYCPLPLGTECLSPEKLYLPKTSRRIHIQNRTHGDNP